MDITDYLRECIEKQIPVSFSKYGDGEVACMLGKWGANCDGDPYTAKKSEALRNAYVYMINEAPNAYIGKWHHSNETHFLESLARQPIQWAKYHSMLFDRHDDEKKAELIKTIHRSNTKKIIVCNRNMSKAQQLLRADHIVYVDFQNWFDTSFDRVLNEVKSHMKQDENHIVITCAGMGSKVLIAELTKAFPKGIYLDYGSALDLICTGRSTREYSDHYSIDYIKNMLSDILPQDW
jgi:hypothetical protein